MDYFVYETGGDNLVRACLTPAAERLSERYVPPDEVVKLVGLGAQWQDPEMFREVRDNPGVNPRHLMLEIMAASTEVPDDVYDDWLDDTLLGTDILGPAGDVHRLVVMSWNYLHNIPFHLLPEIRRRIDAGQLNEVVISPGVALTHRLATRTPVVRAGASCLFVGIDSDEVDAGAEFAAVRESFDRTEALLNHDATPQRVLAAMAGVDVVHIACHGEFDLRRNTTYCFSPATSDSTRRTWRSRPACVPTSSCSTPACLASRHGRPVMATRHSACRPPCCTAGRDR